MAMEAEGRTARVESYNIVNSRRREEDGGLMLHFDVPSAVKEARVLEARNGRLFGRFGVRMTPERLTRFC